MLFAFGDPESGHSDINETSVRHQDRNSHCIQDSPRGPAEDKFAQARMAIAAHDDHVRSQVGRGRQDRVSNVLIVGHDTLEVDLEIMACEMVRDIGARQLFACRFALHHGQYVDRFGSH